LGSKPSITTTKKEISTQKRKIFDSKPSPIIRNKTAKIEHLKEETWAKTEAQQLRKKAVKIEEENLGLKTEPRTKVVDVVNHFEAPHEYKKKSK